MKGFPHLQRDTHTAKIIVPIRLILVFFGLEFVCLGTGGKELLPLPIVLV